MAVNGFGSGSSPTAIPGTCAVVELRRYTLHPGARDRLVTETSANTFPRLPVREGEMVLVSLLRLGNGSDLAHVRALILEAAGDRDITSELTRTPDISHLTPTARSLLR